MIVLSAQLPVQALPEGADVSFGAGWTDTPDALPSTSLWVSPKVPEPRSPRAWRWGQPRITVLGRP